MKTDENDTRKTAAVYSTIGWLTGFAIAEGKNSRHWYYINKLKTAFPLGVTTDRRENEN